jgi:hypothetical protein
VGKGTRRRRTDRRYEAVHRIVRALPAPPRSRDDWTKVLARLMAEDFMLALTRALPHGCGLRCMSALWISLHTITPAKLRDGYRTWAKQNYANSVGRRRAGARRAGRAG